MTTEALTNATATARDALADLEGVLRGLADADLHRAHPDGYGD